MSARPDCPSFSDVVQIQSSSLKASQPSALNIGNSISFEDTRLTILVPSTLALFAEGGFIFHTDPLRRLYCNQCDVLNCAVRHKRLRSTDLIGNPLLRAEHFSNLAQQASNRKWFLEKGNI